jgi:RimJ/RimL family protein N-acetyltransferase
MKIELELVNENLILKMIKPNEYAKKITDWLNDPIINKYLMARHKVNTEIEQIGYIEQVNASLTSYYFGIFFGDNLRLIGTTTCRIKEEKSLEIGIMIGEKAFHGKGLGFSTIKTIESFAKTLGLERLTAGIECENKASAALFLKMGFLFDEELILNEYGLECFQVSKRIIPDKVPSHQRKVESF